MRLKVRAFALSCAIMWSAGIFFLTWWIIAFEGSTYDITLIGHLYRGYSISPAGSIIGAVWAFFDGLIGGAVFAYIYNLICDLSSRGKLDA